MKLTNVGIVLSLAAVVSFSAYTQETHSEHHQDLQAQAVVDDMTAATVRKVDIENGRITLQHEAIKNLGMPGMTMVFIIEETALFEGLAQGDRVRFTVEKKGTAFIITAIKKM
jgi:Cu/Ag efflux protein CusF